MIASGTRITFDVQGSAVRWNGVPFSAADNEEIRANVVRALQPYARLFDVTVTSGAFADVYVGRVVLEPLGDYGVIDDLKSLVAGAFWETAGAQPIVTSPTYGDPSVSETPGPLAELGDVAKWVAIAAVALGAIYVTSKVT